MSNDLLLFVVSSATIIGVRFFVWLIPEVDIRIFGRIIHHFWFGVVFVILSYPLSYINNIVGIVTLAIGLGLIGDELVFIALGGGHDKKYWRFVSIMGAIVSLIIIFYFRVELVRFF